MSVFVTIMRLFFVSSISLSYCAFALFDNAPITCAFNAPKTFGATHFIVGYDANKKVSHTTSSGFTPTTVTYFSPDDDVRKALFSLIATEQESMRVAVYMFTDKFIAQALIDAHNRGVQVEVITDGSCLGIGYNKIGFLCEAGLPIFIYNPNYEIKGPGSIMHHKFVLFGKNKNNRALIWTGSFNFTRAACQKNQENVIVCDDSNAIHMFSRQFEKLKARSHRYRTS